MRQLTPLRVVATRGEEKSGFRLSSGLSAKERSLFTRQLAVLLQSEMPVEMALAAAAGDEANPGVRKLLLGIRAQVLEGTRLADAMKGAPKAFPQLYRSVVAAGESAGRLGEVMEQLAEYLETSLRVRNQIQAALIYPAVLGVMAILMVSALMIWVVPRLIEQFDILGADQLPLLTEFVIGMSGFMRDWGLALVLVAAALALLGKRALDVPAFKRGVDQMSLRLPFFGTLQQTIAAARFARIYATLSVSGATVLESLSAARGAMTNLVFVDAATRISEAVREGGTVSGAMKATGIFPSMMTHMVASGEVARNVPAMMNRAADFLEAEFETSTNVAMGLLEPFIIVILGGVVGTIVLSIMLPIMQLNALALG
jgi:general secretion pathway protein F